MPFTKENLQLWGVAALYGLFAGAIAGATYRVMTILQHLIWQVSDAPWYIFAVVFGAGCIIAAINQLIPNVPTEQPLEDLVPEQVPDGISRRRRNRRNRLALVALVAIIAVAAGGAIGPEAGLIAVVGELSALVSLRLHQHQWSKSLIDAGNAAALGIYGSPLAGAAWISKRWAITPRTLANIFAGATGFVGFYYALEFTAVIAPAHTGIYLPDGGRFSFSNLGLALLAAAFGVIAAGIFLLLHHATHFIATSAANLSSNLLQGRFFTSIILSGVLGLLLAFLPYLRFSGQSSTPAVITQYADIGIAGLAMLVVGKCVATTLTLAARWRGGEFFPLVLIGTAAGALVTGIVPSADIATIALAGIGAATTVVIRKPVAIVLVCIFLIGHVLYIPLLIGVGIGALVNLVRERITARKTADQS